MDLTQKQLKERIKYRMRAYYHANTGPFSVPVGTKSAQLPRTVSLNELNAQTEASKEGLVINLQTVKACFNEQEQEVIKYRLMGYKVAEIGQIMGAAAKTIEGLLTNIIKVGKEVNNV